MGCRDSDVPLCVDCTLWHAACTLWNGEPQGAEGQCLAWADPDSLEEYSMPEADIPLIEPVRRAAMAVREEAKK